MHYLHKERCATTNREREGEKKKERQSFAPESSQGNQRRKGEKMQLANITRRRITVD